MATKTSLPPPDPRPTHVDLETYPSITRCESVYAPSNSTESLDRLIARYPPEEPDPDQSEVYSCLSNSTPPMAVSPPLSDEVLSTSPNESPVDPGEIIGHVMDIVPLGQHQLPKNQNLFMDLTAADDDYDDGVCMYTPPATPTATYDLSVLAANFTEHLRRYPICVINPAVSNPPPRPPPMAVL